MKGQCKIMNLSETEIMPYKIGGLLYTPATNTTIAEKIKEKAINNLTSIVFCLEDSIGDTELSVAEENLKKILNKLNTVEELPYTFIRVRSPEHFAHLSRFLCSEINVLTGFVFPKFDESNLSDYFRIIEKINSCSAKPKYIMPVLESHSIAKCSHRAKKMEDLRGMMKPMKDIILNVRVGGNDFSNLYGVRRNIHQNIYQIGVVRDILVDILNVFADDYVVSGPVWEYYENGTDELWKEGLKKELELDRLNGFIGKTAIHPSQLSLIYESLMPSADDYKDAESIVNWNTCSGVKGSHDGKRMNEVKTHMQWAIKTYILGNIYGVKE